MTLHLLLLFCVLAATLARAVLVEAQVVVAACSSCGRPRERRHLGEPICTCRERGR